MVRRKSKQEVDENVEIKPIVPAASSMFRTKLKDGRTIFSLQNIYAELFERIAWPEPVPRPEELTFDWSYAGTFLGRCSRVDKLIEISCLFKHPLLDIEVFDLMAHEAAHFIWNNHSKNYKDFLKSVGVSP